MTARKEPAKTDTDSDRAARAETALRASEARFHLLADSIPQLAWMANPDGWIFWYNKRWHDFTGATLEEMQGWGWRKVHHPDHLDRVVARIQQAWQTGEPWEDTFPLRGRDGTFRWFLSRALPVHDDDGNVVRWFGTNTDITEIREAEERQRHLLDELNHRVKNTLASVQSIAQMTMRGTHSVDEFESKFNARLLALSRSHNLLARETWQGAALRDVVNETLAAYSGDAGRVTIKGPDVRLGPTAAVTLGMAFHELATNAAKYGALSEEGGHIDVSWSIDWRSEPTPSIVLSWNESGGPAVRPVERRGFGSRLIERGLAQELNAEVALDFATTGLKCRMRMPLSNKISATK
jgi:PAS domain S-box-containing protein